MDAKTQIPGWLTEPYRKVLVAFKRMGGRGSIADVRKAANVKAGDRYAKRLVAAGFFWHQPTDYYGLTPEGYAMANTLIGIGYWRTMIRTAGLLLLTFLPSAAAQPLPQPKSGQCPAGYSQSGGFCAPMRRDAPAAIPKGSGQCPSGWMQSGAYCLEMRRR
jgi:hypothetical protein